jgi:signal transduction histidine kinase
MEDITARGREDELKMSTDDFLGVLRALAHKLSQPLTSLRGSIEVALLGEPNAAESRRILELSLHESQRIAETLEDFRDVLGIEGSMEDAERVSWTQCVEQFLEEAALVDQKKPTQLASSLKSGVWVMASPQQLIVATRRLINSAARVAGCKRKVRIELSATEHAACLSVFEEGPRPAVESLGNFQTTLDPETPLLAGIDKWLVQRAVEHLGGRFELRDVSETCHCYRLNLPLQLSDSSQEAP